MVATVNFSLDEIKNEACHLVETGKIDSHQAIYVLCQFIPPREWICAECELEKNDYLLRDRISDLLSPDEWAED